jgi:hypothetical protein
VTEQPSRAVDLYRSARQAVLNRRRRVGRSDDSHQRSGVVGGMVWTEVLMGDKAAEALAQRQVCQRRGAYVRA